MEEIKKPFNYGTYANTEFFTNRQQEIKALSANFTSGINTILISPRRWGKSSLVWNTALRLKKINKKIRFCFIDLYNVRTEEEFYEAYARELIKISDSKWNEQVHAIKKFFRQVIPQFSLPVDPHHDISLNFEWKQLKRHPDEIIDLAEKISQAKKFRIVVCLDEFQNIAFFSDPTAFQKKLRSHWQKHQHAMYCIYGSKRQMMASIFENPSMPFYKFGDVIFLKKINYEHWVRFIVSRFAKTGKIISDTLAGVIAMRMENHPYFVQQLAQETWQLSGKKCAAHHVDAAIESLLTKMSILYQRETDQLSNAQVNFLKALCNNETRFSTADVLQRYRLNTSANVIKIKRALEQKEIIDLMEPEIQFNDPLFKLWFRKFMMS